MPFDYGYGWFCLRFLYTTFVFAFMRDGWTDGSAWHAGRHAFGMIPPGLGYGHPALFTCFFFRVFRQDGLELLFLFLFLFLRVDGWVVGCGLWVVGVGRRLPASECPSPLLGALTAM